jgi:antimicrobial peptide system SdpB family protein
MKDLIGLLKQSTVHTPRLALVRMLLAFGMLLTIATNDLQTIANQRYERLEGYRLKQRQGHGGPFSSMNLYLMMPQKTANVVVVIFILAVMTGFLPQLTCWLHFWACFSFHNYFITLNGGDDLTLNLALLLIPLCLTDPRLNQWRTKQSEPRTANIPATVGLVAIQLLVAWLYFDAWFFKILTPQWVDGTAVYYYLSHYRVGAPDWLRHFTELITTTQLVRLVTWAALALEFFLSVAIFFPFKYRKRLFVPAIIFHFLILVHLGLITFFIAISAALLLYLDNDDCWTNKILRRK